MNQEKTQKTAQKQPASPMRRRYTAKLVFRCIVFVICVLVYLFRPEEFRILYGMNFFSRFSWMHILWLIWVFDMIEQLVPVKRKIPLGSQKLFKLRFKPVVERFEVEKLKAYLASTTKAAYKVMVLWVALLAVLGVLYFTHVISAEILFLVSVAFYVCDLICVLVWCPFRLMMRTRCCTTCRIFNWDHLMMFTPMMFVLGVFPLSLVALSVAAWLIWELCVMLYPERFWEFSNEALKCSSCTDKLCTQYCRKLRK